jgi:hypothetical protein
MSSQPENKQTGLENFMAEGDVDAATSEEVHFEPSKLANKIGVVAQAGSTVKIDTLKILQEAKRLGIPLNLPPTNVTFFAGRDGDLVEVHQLLEQNQRVAVSAYVKGMGGVGKSELALQYALRHLLTDYRGGVCWLQANSDLAIQLKDFVRVQLDRTFPDDLDTVERLTAYCWKCLAEHLSAEPTTKAQPKKMLVILDDVKDYETLKPYLPPMGGDFTDWGQRCSNIGWMCWCWRRRWIC